MFENEKVIVICCLGIGPVERQAGAARGAPALRLRGGPSQHINPRRRRRGRDAKRGAEIEVAALKDESGEGGLGW